MPFGSPYQDFSGSTSRSAFTGRITNERVGASAMRSWDDDVSMMCTRTRSFVAEGLDDNTSV